MMGEKIVNSIQSSIKEFLLDFRLMRSLQALKRDDVSRSRLYLNKVLAVHDDLSDFYIFVIAFDAMILNAENRHDKALQRLRECKSLLDGKNDADSQYVRLFCQFYECLYIGEKNYLVHRDKSLLLNANSTVKMFLKFPQSWPKADVTP